MTKHILIATSVALALSAAACSREDNTTTRYQGSTTSSTAPDTTTNTASSTTSPSAGADMGPTAGTAGGTVAMNTPQDSNVGATSSSASGSTAGGGSAADLMKSKGCFNCHDWNTKKVGPAYKDVAKKNQGKADQLVAKLKDGQGHMKINATDAEIRTMVQAVLAAK